MQMKAALLALLCAAVPAAAAPWRDLKGLAAKHTPDFVDASGHSYFSHTMEHDHPDYGRTTLSYTAVVPPHVVFLDSLPFLADLSCTADSLSLHVSDSLSYSPSTRRLSSEEPIPAPSSQSAALAAFLSSLQPGSVLVASSDFGCHSSFPSGLEHGRHLSEDGTGGHALYRRVLSSPAPTSGTTVALSTESAGPESAFYETDVKFDWSPPFHRHPSGPRAAAAARLELFEASVARRAALREDLEERNLLDVDSLIKACQANSKLEWDGDASLLCTLEEDDLYDYWYDIFSLNYNPLSQSAQEPVLSALNGTVQCANCYASLDLSVSLSLTIDKYSLTQFRVAVSGSAHAEADVTLSDPRSDARRKLDKAFEELGVGGCMQTIEFFVSYVPIRVKPCWDMAINLANEEDLDDFSVRSGFVFDANATLGVEYNKDSKTWTSIKDWDWSVQFFRPMWQMNGKAVAADTSIRVHVVPEVIFTVYDVVPLNVYPKPYVGIDFNHKTEEQVSSSNAVATARSGKQGIWKVFVDKGRDFKDPDTILPPDIFITVELMDCDGKDPRSDLYSSHAVGNYVPPSSANKVVEDPGCKAKTSVKSFDSSPEFGELLVFEYHPQFKWEAAKNEKIRFTAFDRDSAEFWNTNPDNLGSVIFDAAGAVTSGTVFTTTIGGFANSASVDVVIRWEEWSEADAAGQGGATYISTSDYAEVPKPGCWRPEGETKCDAFKELAHRRLSSVCSIKGTDETDVAATCECSGLNAHLNFGMDLEFGIGEVNLPFKIQYETSAYDSTRYAAGQLTKVSVYPQTELFCIDCQGCVKKLTSRTASDGWKYVTKVNPETGETTGEWKKVDEGNNIGAIVGGVIGGLCAVGLIVGAVVVVKKKGGVPQLFSGMNTGRSAAGQKMKPPPLPPKSVQMGASHAPSASNLSAKQMHKKGGDFIKSGKNSDYI